MYRNRRSTMIVVLALITASSLLVGCAGKSSSAAEAGTGVVTESTLADTIDSSGSIEAEQVETLTWGTSGVVSDVLIKTGDKVTSDETLMELDSTTVPATIVQGYSDLAEAKLALEDAKSSTSTAKAAVALAEAKSAYQDAMGDYYTIGVTYGDIADIDATEAALQIAKINLDNAGKKVVELSSLSEDDMRKATAIQSLITCQENYNKLLITLNYYKSTPDALTVETYKANVALAKANLESAQRAYDRVKDGPSADDIAVAQANVDAAQATINSMMIIAPFNGEVVVVYNQIGDQVKQGDNALILVNRDKMYVEVSIDETSISNIKVGDTATISFDAFPGKDTTGKVTLINPIGTSSSGVVNYTVRVALDKADPSILIGATANVTIQTGSPQTTLFVPVSAVQSDAQGEYVIRVTNSGSERVTVVSGQIVDNTVVVKGDLKAGDVVQLYSTTSSSSSTSNQQNGQNGGGMIIDQNSGGGNPPSGGMMP